MNAAQKIARLESLLERINLNRTAAPSVESVAGPAGRPTPIPVAAQTATSSAPTPVPEAPAISPRASVGRPTPATPMEQAMGVSDEFEIREPSEPELEITYPGDDEPVITIEAEPTPLDVTVPIESALDATPTAPMHTRAPEMEEPRRIQTSTAPPSTPIARVVARPEPRTFGELLDRALALRPR